MRSSIVNRTTAMVLFEPFINGCSYKIRQYMKNELTTVDEKANLMFDYIDTLSHKEANHLRKKYKKKSEKKKLEMIEDAINDGIYINETPLWEEDEALFYKCINILNKFTFLKPDDLYIKKWNREIKILNKYWIGELYMLKLKQSDRRGFSARSTGAIDTKGLPTRSFKSRTHQEQYSTSCIRFGILLNPYIVICKSNSVNC